MTKRILIRTIFVVLVTFVVAGVAALRVRRSLQSGVEYFTSSVVNGNLQKIISATGSVQTPRGPSIRGLPWG